MLNKNAIENIYSSKKLEKTKICSSKGENLVIQNKYNFDSFGNSNPTYDERDALMESYEYNRDGTVSSISNISLSDIYFT